MAEPLERLFFQLPFVGVLKERFRARAFVLPRREERQPLPRLPLRPRQFQAGLLAGSPRPGPARPAGPWPSWRRRRALSGRLPQFWPISVIFRTEEKSVKLAQEKAYKKGPRNSNYLPQDPATTFHHGKPQAGAQKKAPQNPQEKAQRTTPKP